MKNLTQPSNRRQWRALVKKLRRKKIRRKTAQERDRKLEEDMKSKLQDPTYQYWLQQQNTALEFQREAEERQQQYLEHQWLRRELIAQQQFKIDRQRQLTDEAVKQAERLEKEKEIEAELELKRQKQEEKKRKVKAAEEELERLMQRMEDFLEDPKMEVPVELRQLSETRPGRNPCLIFERTNCCRFGLPCVNNHRMPMLSRIIVIRHFFTHPLLEQINQQEYYDNDTMLEYSDVDVNNSYEEFFADVVPELEGFGKIVNVRTVCNIQPYLRGHVFVEYTAERDALKAFINLQGRYYAKKRLNVEFSNIVVWRTAVCGLSFIRKCPQGRNCLYLHLFRNPGNKYNTQLEVNKVMTFNRQAPNARLTTPLLSWNDLNKTPNTIQNSSSSNDSPRNWRWSESPEVELRPTEREEVEKNESKARITPNNVCKNKDTEKSTKGDQHEKNAGKGRSRSKSKGNKSQCYDGSNRSANHKRSCSRNRRLTPSLTTDKHHAKDRDHSRTRPRKTRY